MRYAFFLFLFLTLPGLAAAQDRARLLEFTGPSGQGRSTMVMLISPIRVVINPGQDGAIDADLTGRGITVWDARGGRFVDLGEAARRGGAMGGSGDSSALDAAHDQMAAMIPGMLEGVPPDQLEAVRTALEQAMGLSGQPRPTGPALAAGQQQRLAVAEGLMSEPEIILLDEPSAPYQGFETVLARMLTDDGTALRDYVLAPPEALPGIDAVLEAIRQLGQLHIEITGAPIPPEALLPDFPILAPHGFPVTIEDYATGDRWDLTDYAAVTIRHDAAGQVSWTPAE